MRIQNWPQRYPWLSRDAFTYFENRTKTLPSEIDVTLDVLSEHFTQTPEALSRAVDILRFKQDILWTMLDALWLHFFSKECAIPQAPRIRADDRPILRILGSGAGGGVPQWNGHDEHNDLARHVGERLQCSAAFTSDRKRWVLINCSPDFRSQWNGVLRMFPDARIHAVVLTDAEIDHVGGLLSMRESKDGISIYTSASIRRAVEDSGIPSVLRSYTTIDWIDTNPVPGMTMTQIATKRPKYTHIESDVMALRFANLVYAPVVTHKSALEEVRKLLPAQVIVDGTFETADEMPQVRGHLPVCETLEMFSHWGLPPPRFTRRNHTNRAEHGIYVSDGEELPL